MIARNPFEIAPISIYGAPKKKRESYSAGVKYKMWETKSHMCHICHKRIPSFDAAELDHVRAHSKGGQHLKWAHRSCNRLKGKKGLAEAQRMLDVKRTKKHRTKRARRKKKIYDPLGFGFRQPKLKWGI